MKSLGLYLHIPFCRSKCYYCDFCSFPHMDEPTVREYCSALEKEIASYGNQMHEYTVNTVYFGGGTPTYLSGNALASLLDSVAKHFSLCQNAEITTECNPATVNKETLAVLRRAGFNRLSIGAQSLNDRELALLGRIHTASDFKKTVFLAREANFDNLSADVMFGIPEQTLQSFSKTLTELAYLSLEHISAYGLNIEQGTPFYDQRDTLPLPDEDTERQMYMYAVEFLASEGYERYEISNFCKPLKASRHNLRYWLREDYLGMGVCAHSCLGNQRFCNTNDLKTYLFGEKVEKTETICTHNCLCEAVMLGMRLEEGCNFEALAQRYGTAAYLYRDRLAKYQTGGFVRKTQTGFAFTDNGMYVSNTILSDILDFED